MRLRASLDAAVAVRVTGAGLWHFRRHGLLRLYTTYNKTAFRTALALNIAGGTRQHCVTAAGGVPLFYSFTLNPSPTAPLPGGLALPSHYFIICSSCFWAVG